MSENPTARPCGRALSRRRAAAWPLPAILIFSTPLFAALLFGCSGGGESETPRMFSVADKGKYTEAIDQFNRPLALVPKGAELPAEIASWPASRIVRTPVERVVVTSGTYDPSIIIYLGKGQTIVGTSDTLQDVYLPELRQIIESGQAAHVGNYDALDYEAITALKPDLILVSGSQNLAKFEELGFPAAGTYTGENEGLSAQMDLIIFFGALFGEREKAEELRSKNQGAIDSVRAKTAGRPRPTVLWGLYFGNRVLGMSGDYWFSELIDAAGGDYIFSYMDYSSRELSLEEFLTKGKDVDIYFAQILYETRVDSKKALARQHSDLERFKAFSKEGKVVLPSRLIFQDPASMDKVVMELARVIHPELFPAVPEKYFKQLPDE